MRRELDPLERAGRKSISGLTSRAASEQMVARRADQILAVWPAACVVLVLCWLWRDVLLAPTLIESGDLLFPTSMAALRAMFWPFWNATLGFPNVETVARLPWVAPFLLSPDPLWAQKGLLAAAILGSGAAMLSGARRLGATPLLAVLAAIAYGCNPWIANRVQHYWLLPGYAVLPLVVACWVSPPRRHPSSKLALLLTLGSTTPHFTVFLWGLSLLWVALNPSRALLTRASKTFALYLLLNLFWLLPTVLFTIRVKLVPSVATWEGEVTFSRYADLFAVLRLQGYWWPLAAIWPAGAIATLGFGLPLAALLALTRWAERRTLFLVLGITAFVLLAVGTRLPFLVHLLVLDGPLASHFGWLFRDPNKAVGPLAGLLLIAATSPKNLYGRYAAGLLAAFTVYCAAAAGPYVREVYAAHAPPEGFARVASTLQGQAGRAVWLPQYFGSQTDWNGSNLTPEFPTFSSPVPVLGPYGYHPRSIAAYIAVYFGGLLRGADVDLRKVLPLWGTRWLIVHDDILPTPLQPPGMLNSQLQWLPSGMAALPFPGQRMGALTLYDAGMPVPAFTPAQVSLTDAPLGALFAASLWPDWNARHEAFVEHAHSGVTGLTLLPGSDARMLLTAGHRVGFVDAVRHYDPERYWSTADPSGLEWWQWSMMTTLPRPEAGLLLLTRAPEASVKVRENLAPGQYRVLLRAYRHPQAGAVQLRVGAALFTGELAQPEVAERWLDLGSVRVTGPTDFVLTNIYGFNVVQEVRLVKQQQLEQAQAAVTALPTTWIWPASSLCRDTLDSGSAPASVLVARKGTMPTDQTFRATSPWTAFETVHLTMYGNSDRRTVNFWTYDQNVWVNLAQIRVWWTGWHELDVPIVHGGLIRPLTGTAAAAGRLRMTSSSGPPLPIRDVRMIHGSLCRLDFNAATSGSATLSALSTVPTEVILNGQPLSVGMTARAVKLHAGRNTLAVSRKASLAIRSLRLQTVPVVREADACANRWHLQITPALYVPGRSGVAGGVTKEGIPVNVMNQGYWLPPGRCGPLTEHNPWVRLGWWSFLGSALGVLAVMVLLFFPIRREGGNT